MNEETLRVKRWRKELKRRAIHEGMARNGGRPTWAKRHEKPEPKPVTITACPPPRNSKGFLDKLIGLIRRA